MIPETPKHGQAPYLSVLRIMHWGGGVKDYDIELFHTTSRLKAEKIEAGGFSHLERGVLGRGFYFFLQLFSARQWGVLKNLDSIVKTHILTSSKKVCNLNDRTQEFQDIIKEINHSVTGHLDDDIQLLSIAVEYYAASNNFSVISYDIIEGDLLSKVFNEDELEALKYATRFCIIESSIIDYLKTIPNPINEVST